MTQALTMGALQDFDPEDHFGFPSACRQKCCRAIFSAEEEVEPHYQECHPGKQPLLAFACKVCEASKLRGMGKSRLAYILPSGFKKHLR